MRKEQFGIGTFVHVVNRGAHKINIVRTDADRWRFLKLLRYLNDVSVPRNWERDISLHIFGTISHDQNNGVKQSLTYRYSTLSQG